MSEQSGKFYIAYEDDGTIGMCVQSSDVTFPWRKLYVFYDYDSVKRFYFDIENRNNQRKNPRIVGFWEECVEMPGLSSVVAKLIKNEQTTKENV